METLDLAGLPAEVLEAGAAIAEESGLLAVADAALDATGNKSKAATITGQVVDALIDFEDLELGVLGTFLEAVDDDVAAWIVELALSLAQDPVRRAARQERRADRRAQRQVWWYTRQDRRAQRKAERQRG
jgi:hypothetical protein